MPLHILNCVEKPGRVVKIKYIIGTDIFNRKGIKNKESCSFIMKVVIENVCMLSHFQFEAVN